MVVDQEEQGFFFQARSLAIGTSNFFNVLFGPFFFFLLACIVQVIGDVVDHSFKTEEVIGLKAQRRIFQLESFLGAIENDIHAIFRNFFYGCVQCEIVF